MFRGFFVILSRRAMLSTHRFARTLFNPVLPVTQ